jgi:DNA-directed RNA polymerase specialized sigma24 family protein
MKNPGMTEAGLKMLLTHLSSDKERAGELYLHMHGKLVRYFSWHMCAHPEDLADEALDRVCRRLETGEQVEQIISYILGVARRILLEQRRSLLTQGTLLDERTLTRPAEEGADDSIMECLEWCLEKLAPESRALLVEYYSPEASSRAWVRQTIADRLGLSLNALRNRVLRLRRNMETCISGCRQGGGENVGGVE